MCEQAYCEKRNRQECIAANSLTSKLIVYLTNGDGLELARTAICHQRKSAEHAALYGGWWE